MRFQPLTRGSGARASGMNIAYLVIDFWNDYSFVTMFRVYLFDGQGLSMALGFAELFAAPSLAKTLGMRGRENLIRAFGAREIMVGVTTLSTEKPSGLWSRFGGDLLDIAALCAVYRNDNPRKHNVGIALAAVLGITLIDLVAARENVRTHGRGNGKPRDYSDRSGFPGGLDAARRTVKSGQNPAPS